MWQTRLQIVLLAMLVLCLLVQEWRRERPRRGTLRDQATLLMAWVRSWIIERLTRWKTRHRPVRVRNPIEVAPLQSRIHHLRNDYLVAVQASPPRASGREQVAASIRQAIRRMTCFRKGQTDNPEDVTRETPRGRE